jgi:hypothetical protein
MWDRDTEQRWELVLFVPGCTTTIIGAFLSVQRIIFYGTFFLHIRIFLAWFILDDPVMAGVEKILEKVNAAAELEIIRYAA